MAEFVGFFTARVSPEDSGTHRMLHFGYGEVAHLEPEAKISGLRFWVGGPDIRDWAEADVFPVSIDQPECPAGLETTDFQRIMEFVELNRSVIVELWDMRLEEPAFHAALKPVI
jgi:hypothetical protein